MAFHFYCKLSQANNVWCGRRRELGRYAPTRYGMPVFFVSWPPVRTNGVLPSCVCQTCSRSKKSACGRCRVWPESFWLSGNSSLWHLFPLQISRMQIRLKWEILKSASMDYLNGFFVTWISDFYWASDFLDNFSNGRQSTRFQVISTGKYPHFFVGVPHYTGDRDFFFYFHDIK